MSRGISGLECGIVLWNMGQLASLWLLWGPTYTIKYSHDEKLPNFVEC